MPYSQDDLDRLGTALLQVATSPQRVKFADGREVTYQSVEAIEAAMRVVRAQISMEERARGGVVRRRVPYYRSGL
jgi:hypothetical protein